MKEYTVNVLLIENDKDVAALIRDALADGGSSVFRLQWVTTISSALHCLSGDQDNFEGRFDVILMDLSLPDAQGNGCRYLICLPVYTGCTPASPLSVRSVINDGNQLVLYESTTCQKTTNEKAVRAGHVQVR